MQTTIGIIANCSDCDKVHKILSPIKAKETYCTSSSEIYFDTSKGILKYIKTEKGAFISYFESEFISGIFNHTYDKEEISHKVLPILERTHHKKCTFNIKSESFLIDEIYIHVDKIEELGCFIRIESISIKNDIHKAELQAKCNLFLRKLQISAKDIIKTSYHELSKQNDLFMQMYVE